MKQLFMLQKEFFSLASQYTAGQKEAEALWRELEAAYSHPDRHFHNLLHLQQMLAVLQPVRSQIDDWDSLLFAVFYHDAVYDVVQYVTENNNEDQSAALAGQSLTRLNLPAEKIERCRHHILATKAHKHSADGDTNFLTDADLSILGQPWESYEAYRKAIRKEYAVFPDAIYNSGRTNVLKSFLRTERLFKTEPFQEQYEATAKENLARELEILSF